MLEPDTVRGIPLDMDQYTRLFGTARVPTDVSCSSLHCYSSVLIECCVAARLQNGSSRRITTYRRPETRTILCVCAFPSRHLRPLTHSWRLFFPDWFDVLDMDNRPVLTEREILRNLQAIVNDADKLPIHEVHTFF